MSADRFAADADIGLVGEIEARRELAAEGWLTINTNTEKGNFPNVDLIAAKGEKSRAVQVKTTNGEVGSHRHYLFMGRAERWLTEKKPFFNARPGPLTASVVILVNAKRKGSRFVVMPVGLAEQLARYSVERWYEVARRDGEPRSAGFDARLPFVKNKRVPSESEIFCQKVLLAFEDRWEIMDAELNELYNPDSWKIEFPTHA